MNAQTDDEHEAIEERKERLEREKRVLASRHCEAPGSLILEAFAGFAPNELWPNRDNTTPPNR